MRTFTCLVTDNRYSVPTLTFFLTTDEDRARELARRDLVLNPHHQAFELREGDQLLFTEVRAAS